MITKYLKFKLDTGKFNIKSTQSLIDDLKVKSIKETMINGLYDFEDPNNIIACYVKDNIYYITEGHHRMQAALNIWRETGNYSFVDELIINSIKYETNKIPPSYNFK